MLARLLALAIAMFGPNHGATIRVQSLEWPYCGLAYSSGLVLIATDLQERCGHPSQAVEGMTDVEAYVVAHELCHLQVGITGNTVIDHGPEHQSCTREHYQIVYPPDPPLDIIQLY